MHHDAACRRSHHLVGIEKGCAFLFGSCSFGASIFFLGVEQAGAAQCRPRVFMRGQSKLQQFFQSSRQEHCFRPFSSNLVPFHSTNVTKRIERTRASKNAPFRSLAGDGVEPPRLVAQWTVVSPRVRARSPAGWRSVLQACERSLAALHARRGSTCGLHRERKIHSDRLFRCAVSGHSENFSSSTLGFARRLALDGAHGNPRAFMRSRFEGISSLHVPRTLRGPCERTVEILASSTPYPSLC